MTVAQCFASCSISRVPARTSQAKADVNAAVVTLLNWGHDVREDFGDMIARFMVRMRSAVETEVSTSRSDTSAGSWQA